MLDDAQLIEQARPVLDQYGLAGAEMARFKKGHSNRHLTVDADGRRYILRRYLACGENPVNRRQRPRENILFEHRVLAAAREGGIPSVPPLPNRLGQTLTERDERFYALFPWVESTTYVSGLPAYVAGAAMLGKFHRVMAAAEPCLRRQRPCRGFRPQLGRWFHECEGGLGSADEIVAWARSLQPRTPTQQYIHDNAALMGEVVATMMREFPHEIYDNGRCVVNHGDFYFNNLGFTEESLVAIFDFDDCCLDHPMLDLGVLIYMSSDGRKKALNLEVADAVVAAYRQTNEMTGAELALLPYFIMAHMVHIAITLSGIVRCCTPEADLLWLTQLHLDLAAWTMEQRKEISAHFNGL